eukprot:CAMPEP_0184297712 /NCGR_PEP_ID=MMETSP1049-20130417/8595_1 /TAXON_ID=77928 /ORGANISM="Proteomonas sulcata, Strain CCMP704" /LENGTH=213 /DNA_ID=CAMNT_0026607553 /DNA_START=134 /DNA_END=774 /DNA_ORIENTATION=-
MHPEPQPPQPRSPAAPQPLLRASAPQSLRVSEPQSLRASTPQILSTPLKRSSMGQGSMELGVSSPCSATPLANDTLWGPRTLAPKGFRVEGLGSPPDPKLLPTPDPTPAIAGYSGEAEALWLSGVVVRFCPFAGLFTTWTTTPFLTLQKRVPIPGRYLRVSWLPLRRLALFRADLGVIAFSPSWSISEEILVFSSEALVLAGDGGPCSRGLAV